nr:MAG TPA: hypothetical protein [Caudoviricetes sp.]
MLYNNLRNLTCPHISRNICCHCLRRVREQIMVQLRHVLFCRCTPPFLG